MGRPKQTHCKRGHLLDGNNLYIYATGVRVCRSCQLERSHKQYDANPELASERKQRQYAANPELYRARNREYSHRWVLANPERRVEHNRKNRETHPEYQQNYKLRHPEKIRESNSKYAKTHPEKNREKVRRYNARKKSSVGWFPPDYENLMFKLQEGKCAYCDVSLGMKFHLEHRVPFSRGGPHSFENVVLSCVSCNLHKGTMTDVEYLARVSM